MNEEFSRALQLHQQGQLRDAEIGYRTVLEQNPQHADALHLLGVIAHQCGNARDAAQWIERAVSLNPNCAAYYSNLADVYRVLGRADQAVDCCELALQLDPNYLDAQNNLGLSLLQLCRFAEAEDAFANVIQQNPNFVAAHNNLGHALREQDRIDEAIAAYREAVRLAPDMAEAHNNLGQILLESGEVDDSLIHCREAVRLKPDFPQAHSNLGNVLREQGKPESAAACYREALRLNDRIAMIHNNVAQLLQEQGRLDEAVMWYRQALELEPETPRFHANLASALTEQENYDEAISHYREAIRLQGDYAEAYNGLGTVYRELEDSDQAIATLREAIHIKASLAPAHNNLGQALAEAGRLDESLAAFLEAIDHEPRSISAWTNIATHHRKRLSAAEIRQIESLLTEPYLKDGQRAALHFALAQIYNADRDYERAAEAARLANVAQLNANQRHGDHYSAQQHSQFVDQLMLAFDNGFFEKHCRAGESHRCASELPVFIVGLPRSGTTLTEQILASHPNVHGAGELRFARQSLDGIGIEAATADSCVDHVSAMTADDLRQCSENYLARLRALNPAADRIVDKMPDNYLYLGWIVALFPRARIIHCRRDLRDVALSCWMTSFKTIRWANDVDHIVNRIDNYQRIMNHWSAQLPRPILEIDYEETVADLPAVARRLIDWIGQSWDDRCLDFHTTNRPIRTASVSQVRQPIYSRSVGRWKNYQRQLANLFEPLA